MLIETKLRRPAAAIAAGRIALEHPIVLVAALATLLMHVAWNANYGFFRDELYFIVCGRHPALGYVDQPSLTPLLAGLTQLFGASLFTLRLIPAICAAITVWVTCALALELGAGSFALALTAIVTALSPELLAFGTRLSTDSVESWTWPLIALLVLRIVKGAHPRMWLVVGLVAAAAAWSKYTVGFFVAALVAALLCTSERRVLRSGWFAAGMGLTALLIAPNVYWQWQHQFPMLQLLHNDYGKFLLSSPPFFIQQIMIMSPLLSIVWIAGLIALAFRAQTRFLALTYIILLGAMWLLDAKNYYPACIYPYLLAAGAVAIERLTSKNASAVRFRPAIAIAAILFALPSVPFELPVLPLPAFINYQKALGATFHISFHTDAHASNSIPIQYYADMTGWPELTQSVGEVYGSLPAADRRQTAILTRNFGEASAIDMFGDRYGLPGAISGNNNYWIWGPGKASGAVVIDVNGDARADAALFESVRLAAVFHNPYGMPYENDIHIYLCRGLRMPVAQLWPRLKDYSYGLVLL